MYIIGQEEIDAVTKVLKSGNLSRYSWKKERKGECELFEEELGAYFSTKHSLLLTSGTNALISALVGCGIGPGDEVIIPAYTYVATAGAVVAVGAIPVVCNVDEKFAIDPKSVKDKISSRTKAVIPVHMNGRPCDMAALNSLLSAYPHISLIEDVAQAIGAKFQGKMLGTFGRAGCFSFNNYKTLTCGEGGAMTTSELKVYERAFINHDMGLNFRDYIEPLQEPIFLGSSMRVSEISGALMRVQLGRLSHILRELKTRQKIILSVFSESKLFKVNQSHCPEGEAGTSIVLDFPSAAECLKAEGKLRALGMFSSQILKFYRHVHSSWDPLLKQRGGNKPFETASNGIEIEGLERSHELFQRSMLLFVPFELSVNETEPYARKLLAEMAG